MSTDTKTNKIIINTMSKAQYEALTDPSENELYLVPDDTDTKLATKQDKFTTGNGLTMTTTASGNELSANVINNVTSTSETDSLSAKMGKELNERINNLEGRGRFLSVWLASQGKPETEPGGMQPGDVYQLKAGDYYIISSVDKAEDYEEYDSTETYNTGDKVTYNDLFYICNEDGVTGEWDATKWTLHTITNYKPTGTTYIVGSISTTVETEDVNDSDVYYFDGTTWLLWINTQKEVAFANITGDPYSNTNLSNALTAKQNKLTAGTNITIDSNNVISSTAADNSFRGSWINWTNVPTDASSYPADVHGSHTPLNGDYIVVQDASDYPIGEYNTPYRIDVVGGDVYTAELYTFDKDNVQVNHIKFSTNIGQTLTICNGHFQVYVDGGSQHGWTFTAVENTKYGNTIYLSGQQVERVTRATTKEFTIYIKEGSVEPLSGTWRFHYTGTWATVGRDGWIPEYNVKEVLPIASATQSGIAKLYTETGTNTDGSMDQNSITNELESKQDTLTAGTNITIDANNVISSVASESFFRGNWNNWSAVPTADNLYPADIHGNHTPRKPDYMIVKDASDYNDPSNHTITYATTGATREWTLSIDGVQTASGTNVYGTTTDEEFGIENELMIRIAFNGTTDSYIYAGSQTPVKYNDTVYSAGTLITTVKIVQTHSETFHKPVEVEYDGSWRFTYDGTWTTDNKSGWKPEYQVEETLPIASSTQLGIAKLYTTTGTNTDGSMDQNSITTALSGKQDTLTAGTNITISGTTISAVDTSYIAGSGISISDDTISARIGTGLVNESGVTTTNNIVFRRWTQES